MRNNSVIGPTVVEISFNEAVINIKAIIREARHMELTEAFANELPKFNDFLDNVGFKSSFVFNVEGYLKGKMLDTMDYILDNWFENMEPGSNSYRVANSIYDVIREWYFKY